MSVATQRGVDLGLNDDEVAFYDALVANNSAVEAMGEDTLKVIATKLVTQVRKSFTIDWTHWESARAGIKVLVKRILRKHRYPTDLEAEATKTVLVQAELLCAEWAAQTDMIIKLMSTLPIECERSASRNIPLRNLGTRTDALGRRRKRGGPTTDIDDTIVFF